jgi:hypothetical protein
MKSWLDPIVENKIHFIENLNDLILIILNQMKMIILC